MTTRSPQPSGRRASPNAYANLDRPAGQRRSKLGCTFETIVSGNSARAAARAAEGSRDPWCRGATVGRRSRRSIRRLGRRRSSTRFRPRIAGGWGLSRRGTGRRSFPSGLAHGWSAPARRSRRAPTAVAGPLPVRWLSGRLAATPIAAVVVVVVVGGCRSAPRADTGGLGALRRSGRASAACVFVVEGVGWSQDSRGIDRGLVAA